MKSLKYHLATNKCLFIKLKVTFHNKNSLITINDLKPLTLMRMKLILTIISILILSTPGFSQRKIIGLKAFGGLSNASNAPIESNVVANYGITFTGAFRMTKHLYFNPGIGFEKNGYQFKRTDINPDSKMELDVTMTHNYVTVPVQLLCTGLGKYRRIAFEGGFYYSYLLSMFENVDGYRSDDDGVIKYNSKENLIDSKENISRNDLGVNFEINYEVISSRKNKLEFGLYGRTGFIATIEPGFSKNYSIGIKLQASRMIR